MSELLDSFATCDPAEVDATVEKALQVKAEFLGTDHAFVIRLQEDKTCWSVTHEWCGPNVTPKIHEYQNVPMGTIPGHGRLLQDGGIARIESAADRSQDVIKEVRFRLSEGSRKVTSGSEAGGMGRTTRFAG